MALVAAFRVLHTAHAMNVLATLAALMLCVVRWAWRLLWRLAVLSCCTWHDLQLRVPSLRFTRWRLAVLSCCTWHDLQLRVPRLRFTRGKLVCQTDLWAQKKTKHIPVRRNSGPISCRTGAKLGVRSYADPA